MFKQEPFLGFNGYCQMVIRDVNKETVINL